MATQLTRIGTKARNEPKLVFNSLYHHVCDVDNLRAAYESLERRKAAGVDGIVKDIYGENLEENLQELSEKLKKMGYRPQPSRRSYVPKREVKKDDHLASAVSRTRLWKKQSKTSWSQSMRRTLRKAVTDIVPG